MYRCIYTHICSFQNLKAVRLGFDDELRSYAARAFFELCPPHRFGASTKPLKAGLKWIQIVKNQLLSIYSINK